MKKLFAFFLSAAFALQIAPIFAENPFSGGVGSASDPYQIATAADLDYIRNFLGRDAHFVQTADITFGADDYFAPIGDGAFTPFRGSFDGNGNKFCELNYFTA